MPKPNLTCPTLIVSVTVGIEKFSSSRFLTYPLHIAYNNRALTVTENIKFLGSMHLDCHLTWKSQLDNLVKKIECEWLHVEKIVTCCKCKNITNGLFCTFLFTNQLWYKYLGFIFVNEKCFIIQKKKVISIMLRLGPGSSCRDGCRRLDILTAPCLYIYGLMLFAIKNINFIKLTPLFMICIQGSKTKCIYHR